MNCHSCGEPFEFGHPHYTSDCLEETTRQRDELLEAARTAADMLAYPSDHFAPAEWARRAAAVLRAAIAKEDAVKR